MGDADYIYAFQQLVMPIAMEFNPHLVMSKENTSYTVLRLIN